MKEEKLNAIVGIPRAFKIMESVGSDIKHYDIHLVISDGERDYTVVVITNEKDLKFWKEFLSQLVELLGKQNYIG